MYRSTSFGYCPETGPTITTTPIVFPYPITAKSVITNKDPITTFTSFLLRARLLFADVFGVDGTGEQGFSVSEHLRRPLTALAPVRRLLDLTSPKALSTLFEFAGLENGAAIFGNLDVPPHHIVRRDLAKGYDDLAGESFDDVV